MFERCTVGGCFNLPEDDSTICRIHRYRMNRTGSYEAKSRGKDPGHHIEGGKAVWHPLSIAKWVNTESLTGS